VILRSGGMAQVLEWWLSKSKTLSSNANTLKK
jgi:hypothetical protein